MSVAHTELREMAFQMRQSELRQIGQDILSKNPERVAAKEVLDLMATLISCDFEAAEATLALLEFKFKDTKDEQYVAQAILLARIHIDYAFGRFKELEETANAYLSIHKGNPDIEAGEYLDVLRILAQKYLIMDEYEKLRSIDDEVLTYKHEDNSPNILYLINSIRSMRLLADGEFIEAKQIAKLNLQIANQHKYKGLMAPIESEYVVATCMMAMGKRDICLSMYIKIKEDAQELHIWPWHLIASGYISRNHAHKAKFAEALAIVREERELLDSFNFKHELDFIPDVDELYVRFLVGDQERMDVLFSRVPKLAIVEQIHAFQRELNGEDLLAYINELPEKSSRDKVFKNVALAEYYKEKESVSVDYMELALKAAENSGATEIFLRQYHLTEIILKAASKSATVFSEELAAKMAERVKQKELQNKDGALGILTSRELEVIRHLSTGKTISSIAETLHISMNTIKTHLKNTYRKLNVDGREAAVEKAKELLII